MRVYSFILLLLLAAGSAFAENQYIPVAGLAPGANNTLFRTDVRIFNPAPYAIDVTLHFLPTGIDGSNISGRVFHIGPRQMLVLDNVVEHINPGSTTALGAVRIDSDTDASYAFLADSRTWTSSPNPQAPGSYGQFIPAMRPEEARLETVVLHLSNTPERRTNIGAMNPGPEAATVKATLYPWDGSSSLESAPFVLPAMSMKQVSLADLFGGLFLVDGYVVFESTHPLFTWGSVIDNQSGDPFYIIGRESKEERIEIF